MRTEFMSKMVVCLLVVFASVLFGTLAYADSDKVKAVIAVDLDNRKDYVLVRGEDCVLNLPAVFDAFERYDMSLVKHAIKIEDGDGQYLAGLVDKLSEQKDKSDALKTCLGRRVVSEKDDVIIVLTFTKNDSKIDEKADIDVTEDSRNTQITADIGKIVKVVIGGIMGKAGFAATGLAPTTPSYRIAATYYHLREKRSDMTIKVTYKEGPADPKPDKVFAAEDITTGPKEHWHLSLDVPVTKFSQVKYNQETKSLDTVKAPTRVYLGIDYMLGDLLTTNHKWSDWKRLYERVILKAMILASNKPLDSLGIGVGYRLSKVQALGLELDAVTVFGAALISKEDALINGAGQSEYKYGKPKYVIGLSFNTGKAKDWLK